MRDRLRVAKSGTQVRKSLQTVVNGDALRPASASGTDPLRRRFTKVVLGRHAVDGQTG